MTEIPQISEILETLDYVRNSVSQGRVVLLQEKINYEEEYGSDGAIQRFIPVGYELELAAEIPKDNGVRTVRLKVSHDL